MPTSRRFILAAAMAVLPLGAMAQAPATTRIRGTIVSVDGATMTVATRTGQTVAIALADNLTVSSVKKLDLSALTDKAYVGMTTRTGPDGKTTAIEVHVFPESARGAGEGSRPWDLEPNTTMTNGTITGAITATAGRELTVTYKDGTKTVFVPPQVPIVTFVPAQRADLKPGAAVFLIATDDGGKLSASRVTVGKDGVEPPM
ncbi:hypothetical protein [Rhodopila sp.]|jgi:hypothetical protein|uniref:hypothetical protein n=1 Tax=Rhodopila sp. TaxID=2480087 RepID=UPI002CABD9BD|nr:hypothetical protein [Rhodopila sp.]HVZ07530.1 hypothetical protein [Rhodopila sp.]